MLVCKYLYLKYQCPKLAQNTVKHYIETDFPQNIWKILFVYTSSVFLFFCLHRAQITSEDDNKVVIVKKKQNGEQSGQSVCSV